jgi:mitochondrial fission protein ELM1
MPGKILIVHDGIPGHVNQSVALCEGLGCAYDLAEVRYRTRARKACSYLLDRCGVLAAGLFDARVPAGEHVAVVGTGSTAFYPAKVLARRRGLPVAAILTPRGYRMDFDCIVAPAFDRPPARPNIVTVPVNLAPVNDAFYDRGVAAFRERHAPRQPAVGVILGGPNAYATLRAADVARDLARVFAATEGCERWVTTSRRTPSEVDALVDSLPFDFRQVFRRDPFNPIPAFVMLCETLFVTGDSTGMISEAVIRGRAAVEILMNLRSPRSKYARLVSDLAAAGAVHVFDGTLGRACRKIDLAPALRQAARLLRVDGTPCTSCKSCPS